MPNRSKHTVVRWATLGVVVFTYFVVFPQDLSLVLGPFEKLLALTNSISPWLYGVVAVAIAAWAVIRVWGRPSPAEWDAALP
jgi:hypothetical protein